MADARRPLPEESGLPPDITGTVVTVGTFDGVHLGHQDVLRRLRERGRETGLRSVLVTFEPHPLEVVNPAAAPQLLTTRDEKIEVLAETGLDYAAVLPFTERLRRYTPEEFVDSVLLRRMRMRELLIGFDHGFGREREGSADALLAIGARRDFRVDVIPPVTAGDVLPVSSTSIRRAVAGGDLNRAATGLGRPYSIGGRVIEGARRGRLLGFPTINVELPPPRKLLPPDGVYAVRAQTPLGTFAGMMNLGGRPTFGDGARSLEIHLFDAEGTLYGAHVRIELVQRLRDTVRFESAAALTAQLERDAAAARSALTPDRPTGNLDS
ncbi:MAG: bifunctional riboflavin kinase/FAD synthetase [Gemmatimonadaceae bacterium]